MSEQDNDLTIQVKTARLGITTHKANVGVADIKTLDDYGISRYQSSRWHMSKAGALLKHRESAQGQRSDLVTPGDQVKETLTDLGISKGQSSKWRRTTTHTPQARPRSAWHTTTPTPGQPVPRPSAGLRCRFRRAPLSCAGRSRFRPEEKLGGLFRFGMGPGHGRQLNVRFTPESGH